jgi:hypothetical protein
MYFVYVWCVLWRGQLLYYKDYIIITFTTVYYVAHSVWTGKMGVKNNLYGGVSLGVKKRKMCSPSTMDCMKEVKWQFPDMCTFRWVCLYCDVMLCNRVTSLEGLSFFLLMACCVCARVRVCVCVCGCVCVCVWSLLSLVYSRYVLRYTMIFAGFCTGFHNSINALVVTHLYQFLYRVISVSDHWGTGGHIHCQL